MVTFFTEQDHCTPTLHNMAQNLHDLAEFITSFNWTLFNSDYLISNASMFKWPAYLSNDSHQAEGSFDWTASNIHSGPYCQGLDWQMYMEMVVVPIMAIPGLIGNTLSFLVLFSPVYSQKSYSYYLRALAFFDSLTLVISTVLTFNEVVFNFSDGAVRYLGNHTSLTCKLSEYFRHVIYLMSSWLIVCFTVDRYIAVCHPLQRARLCTRTGALLSLTLVFSLACLSQSYILVLVENVDRTSAMLCHARREERLIYMGVYYFFFSFALRFAVPFVIIVILNGLIIYHIRRVKSNPASRRLTSHRGGANMAVCTLFVVSLVFVVTLLPNAVIAMLQFIYYMIYRSTELYCPLKAVDAPFQMLRLLNYSANFVLYGMTGRQFRTELRKLLNCQLSNISNLNHYHMGCLVKPGQIRYTARGRTLNAWYISQW